MTKTATIALTLTEADRAELLALLEEFRRDWPPGSTPESVAAAYGDDEGTLCRRVDAMLQKVRAGLPPESGDVWWEPGYPEYPFGSLAEVADAAGVEAGAWAEVERTLNLPNVYAARNLDGALRACATTDEADDWANGQTVLVRPGRNGTETERAVLTLHRGFVAVSDGATLEHVTDWKLDVRATAAQSV